jgi:hypothetical protein
LAASTPAAYVFVFWSAPATAGLEVDATFKLENPSAELLAEELPTPIKSLYRTRQQRAKFILLDGKSLGEEAAFVLP